MRLRHVANGKQILTEHTKVITQPENYNYKITNLFNNNKPIHIELGAGKGKFIRELASKNKDINYFAFEKDTKVIFRWLKNIENDYNDCLDNYYIVHSNADMLLEIFPKNTIQKIYLNFSDPWPKPRHHKRRLTDKKFLDLYKVVLKEKGTLQLKTDNNDLFDYSISQLDENGWKILTLTRDLHNSEDNQENIMTEYEEKFAYEGKKINKLIATY